MECLFDIWISLVAITVTFLLGFFFGGLTMQLNKNK